MMDTTIKQDTFARDHLPPESLWPQMTYPEGSVFDYPARLNCAVELLDKMVEAGHAGSPLIHQSLFSHFVLYDTCMVMDLIFLEFCIL